MPEITPTGYKFDTYVVTRRIKEQLKETASAELAEDVVLTINQDTEVVDVNGKERPYVRVEGIVGEAFMVELLDVIREAKYLNYEWYWPQIGLFIDADGVEHWPPQGDEAVYCQPLEAS